MNDLLDAMRAHGLNPPTEMQPGKFFRFPSNDKPSDKAGWCRIFPDGKGAVFGNHRTGLQEVWQASHAQPMTATEKQEWAQQVTQAKAEAEAHRNAEYATAAEQAQKVWDAAKPANMDHPYLAKKQVQPFGFRQSGDRLLVPIHGNDGALQSIQYIDSKGAKKFLPGGKVQGGRYWLQQPAGDNPKIYLGEGAATMGTVAEATQDRAGIVCCFTANNLMKVAKDIRAAYPQASLIIAGDDDRLTQGNPGRTKAEAAARSSGASAIFPTFEDGDPGTDFNDMRAAYGADAVKQAVTVTAAAKKTRPVLQLDNGKWPELIQTVITRLSAERALFDLGGVLVKIDAHGGTFPVVAHGLLSSIESLFKVEKFNERLGAYVPAKLPLEFAQRLLAAKESWNFPQLNGTTNHRVLRPDGTLLDRPGYDDRTGIYLHYDGTTWPPIPDNIREAVQTLWYPLSQMPFVSPADAGAALALLLTAVQRPALPLAPLFILSAPAIASGKTQIGLVAKILTGDDQSVEGFGSNPEEQQKRLFSILLRGSPSVLLDNISGTLGGDDLAAILTCETYSSRILGQSATAKIPTRMLMMATGINLIPAADLTRRTLTIRVDPKVERAELRQFDFDPTEWATAHRNEMQAAAIAILKYARPHKEGMLGSFNAWSGTVRAAVLTLIEDGLTPCPMTDPLDVVSRERATDPEAEDLAALLHGWHALCGERFVTLKDLVDRAGSGADTELLGALDGIAGNGKGNINSRRLGKYLRRHENRIVEGLQVMKGRETYLGVAWKVTNQGLQGFKGSSTTHTEFSQDTIYAKYNREGETYPDNPVNPEICPSCSGEGCSWCNDTGVLS